VARCLLIDLTELAIHRSGQQAGYGSLPIFAEGNNMRLPRMWFVVLALWLSASSALVYGQNPGPSSDGERAASKPATEEEVEQLRHEVRELRTVIQKMLDSGDNRASSADKVAAASAVVPSKPAETSVPAAAKVVQGSKDPAQKKSGDSPTSGWNGEHFFLKSPDGQFILMPVGYLNANYSFYKGDGAPPDTFAIRRARFGVQGSYGKEVDYQFLFDSAASNGISIRDAYLNFKPYSQLQFQAGQFKEPFSQEVGTGDTNLPFIERSIVSVLYPSAAGTFRAPGVSVHGDIDGGIAQYWVGMFNGKGIIANNTTNEPEVVGRLRFTPWKKTSNIWLNRFSVGGSAGHGRSRGLSNELSFNGTLNDSAYTFFPALRINGAIERYNGEFAWLKGSWGFRGEYTQLNEHREGVGSEAVTGTGFQTLPGVVAKGAYGQFTYLLTGEEEPENWIPKVKHPVIGPESPGVNGGRGWGAWQIKFRYAYLQGKAQGASFDGFAPTAVPTWDAHTEEFSTGVNWYLNYWVLLKIDVNLDRLENPSVQGIVPQNYYVFQQGLQFRF
jgi:phosphate-selective porin